MDYNERTCIIILNLKGVQVGFIVDTVDEVIDIDKANISAVPKISDKKAKKYIEGVGKLTNKIVMLVNAQKMLNDEEIKGLESMSGLDPDDFDL
jgi:purine-binding chemotaxis protein CheW